MTTVVGSWISKGGAWLPLGAGGPSDCGDPPEAPTSVTMSVASVGVVALMWQDNPVLTTPIHHYEVYLCETPAAMPIPPQASFTMVGEIPFSTEDAYTPEYTFGAPGQFVFAYVRPIGMDDGRGSAVYAQTTVVPDPLPTAPVGGLGVYANPTENWLDWQDPAVIGNADNYETRYAVDPATAPATPTDGTLVGTTAFTTSQLVHTRVPAEDALPHHYSVFAKRPDGLYSPPGSFTVVQGPLPPPMGLRSVIVSTTQVDIFWDEVLWPGNSTGWRLIVKQGGYASGPEDPAASVLLDNVSLDTLSYTHANPPHNVMLCYSLCLVSPTGYGPMATTSKTVVPPPGAVRNATGLPAWAYGDSGYWLFWDVPAEQASDPLNLIDHYTINESTSGFPGYGGNLLMRIPSSADAYYEWFTVREDTLTRYYSVYANNGADGPFSNIGPHTFAPLP